MKKLRYISSDKKIMGGKPCFRGTRIAVCTVLNALSAGDSVDTVLKHYPDLTTSHIREAWGLAAYLMDYEEKVIPA
ncbi:MAG: DUF433 domain-containing protein [Desulfobacteria bacterium]